MIRLTIETDNIEHANLLLSFLKTIKLVKKVNIEKPLGSSKKGKKSVPENSADSLDFEDPTKPYDWTNPSRPARDEEIDLMLEECEKSLEAFTADEVIDFVKEELIEWRKKKK